MITLSAIKNWRMITHLPLYLKNKNTPYSSCKALQMIIVRMSPAFFSKLVVGLLYKPSIYTSANG
jgi:hypothetical protein